MLNSIYNKKYVSKGEALAFGFAGGGQNFFYALITSYLMYYYINVFHIDAKIVGLMLLVVGLWDIVNNPLVGIIIDKTRTKQGKMLPYLRWFMIPLALFTILLFSGSQILSDNSPLKVLYMVLTYLCWELCYTFTDVSYWGLSSVISPNPEERRKILTTTNIIINIFAAIPQVLVPIFFDYAEMSNGKLTLTNMFFIMGLCGGIIGVGLFSLSGIFVKERIEQSKETPSAKESLEQLVKNPALRIVIISNLFYSLSGIGMVFSTYYFIDVLGYASLSVISQIPFAIFAMLSYSLIEPLKKKLNNKQIMILIFLYLGLVQLLIYLIGRKFYNSVKIMIPLIMIYNAVLGLSSGFLGVIPNEMLGEATDYAEWTTGKRNEGVSFSLKIATNKLHGTITQSFGAMLLSLIGYVTSTDATKVIQPDSVKQNIWTMFYLVPAIITLLCEIPYLFYPLVGKKREQMYAELKEKRNNK